MNVITNIPYLKKEKQNSILFLFFLFLSATFLGQHQQVETKKEVIDSLITASKAEVKKGNYSSAMLLVKKGLSEAQTINIDKSIADCFNQIATIYFYQGSYYDALANFENSNSFYKKANFKNGMASSTNNKGAIHYYLGNYSKALDHYKIALKLHEELNNEAKAAGTTQNIGNIYLILKEYTKAKQYYVKAENIYLKTANNKSLSLVLSSLGDIELKTKNYTKALHYLEKSLQLAKDNDVKQTEAEVLFNLGKLFEAQQNLKKSSLHYQQSLTIAKKVKSSRHQSSALIALGQIQHKKGFLQQAIQLCEKGLNIAKTISSISQQKEACECLYLAYKKANNPIKALLFNEQHYVLKDSLNLKTTSDKLLSMEFEREQLLDSIATAEKERVLKLKHREEVKRKETQRNIFIIAVCFAILIAVAIFSRLNYVKKSKAILQLEKDRSEHLLHNILPVEVADELKEKGYVDAQDFEKASILFTDFKSFTETASKLSPKALVQEINACFKAFDAIMEKYGIEKIKTIGDAYMAAGGLPKPDATAVKKTILAGLEMQEFMVKRNIENKSLKKPAFEMRVGIHVGPIVAGIVGVKKFQYDVWGDTVNIASRMESNSEVGKVNISENTYQMVMYDPNFTFEHRGKISVKGKGGMEMYFVARKASVPLTYTNRKKELV
ncbi:adenylate/guanylate cyclase domain-containing protein [Aquimarina brevivitae]|uniref:Adenylate cyclase n=1 Tax=Aquimarina brevivitae TaxID=323412 RepID=A0A4Q7PG27_9FLAO|nr:adenylate/guanylate cyclase domain-containing protein [Aquimarina brevivitae]RZS99441.1 class 3 adenylate cyclase [Aquimarina brevivitae]